MRYAGRILGVVGLGLVLAADARALYTERTTERFGPPPVGVQKSEDKRFALEHLAGRRYWYHHQWAGWSMFQHQVRVAGEADNDTIVEILEAFAALPMADKEIRVLPAPGVTRSADGRKSVACDWQIEWMSHTMLPRGERKVQTDTQRAVLTLYVARAGTIASADPRTPQWIEDLNDARFAVRQEAFRALGEQGDGALPLLGEALTRNPSAEQKTRLEQLVARLKPLHLLRLKMPKGIPVRALDELMKREQENWRRGDLGKSWSAAGMISAWAEHTEDALPLLVEMLQDDREQVRDLAVSAFGRLGRRALSALEALNTAEQGAAHATRPSLRQVIRVIDSAPGGEGIDTAWQRNRHLRQDITAACATLSRAK